MQPEISVVIPVYCEEAGIRLTLQQVGKFVASTASSTAITAKVPKTLKPAKGEACYAVEGARGKILVHVRSDGGPKPYRVKLRSPSFSNLSLFAEIAEGTLLSDAVAILGSLDLVIPEIDR